MPSLLPLAGVRPSGLNATVSTVLPPPLVSDSGKECGLVRLRVVGRCSFSAHCGGDCGGRGMVA